MSNLINLLLKTKKNHDNHLIENLDLIKGYTQDEIKEIGKRYNLSIHGQFREFLMIMGKCSGGLLFGNNLFLYSSYSKPTSFCFGLKKQQDWQDDNDIQNFKNQINNLNLVENQFFEFAENNGEIRERVYFLLTKNQDDIIYCWNFEDEENESVTPFGTLFDFLCEYRRTYPCPVDANRPDVFKKITTGKLL